MADLRVKQIVTHRTNILKKMSCDLDERQQKLKLHQLQAYDGSSDKNTSPKASRGKACKKKATIVTGAGEAIVKEVSVD